MATRITGKWGQLYLPVSDGAASDNVVLTEQASKEISGQTYAYKFHSHSMTHWNRGKPLSVTVQGVVGEVDVSATATSDCVSVGTFKYYENNSDPHSIDGQSIELSRSAANYEWHMLQVVMSTGSIVVTKGAAGTGWSYAWSVSGGPGRVSTANLLLAAVQLEPGSAAVITGSEITNALADGTLIQERTDIPAYEIFPLDGGVLVGTRLLQCHTAGAGRKIYASFYSQKNVLAAVAHTTKWSLQSTNSTVEMPAQGDYGTPMDLTGTPKTSGSFERYAVDDSMSKLAVNKRRGYVKLYRDRNDTEYREAAVIITNISENCDQGAAITESLSFEVDQNIEWR